MRSPLDPFLSRVPTVTELRRLTPAKVRAVRDAAAKVEAMTGADVAETLAWARKVRIAAERAMEKANT